MSKDLNKSCCVYSGQIQKVDLSMHSKAILINAYI